MLVDMPYGRDSIRVSIPDDAIVYHTAYPERDIQARNLVLESIRSPLGCPSLSEKLKSSGARSVIIVVSDITRPIPYADFLDIVLEEIEGASVSKDNITILIATGMHRPSTTAEREHMFGPAVCEGYRIVDHQAEKKDELVTIPGESLAGRKMELNRHFVEADFRIVTGLVEPHFMAGFSGGRKAVCPGLCSPETIKDFHSFDFLNNPASGNSRLKGNPLHDEALSIARQAKVDFCINLVVDRQNRLIEAFSGGLEISHNAACDLVGRYACPPVKEKKDVVLTSCGGYPLDATFYQCVKGMVACLPVVRRGGAIISMGSCLEGIGGKEYRELMFAYTGRWREFLKTIKDSDHVIKDQWEFQMQIRALEHVGEDNLIFVTDGLGASDLKKLSVNGIHVREGRLEKKIQEILNGFIGQGRSLAVIPEGPYCTPLGVEP